MKDEWTMKGEPVAIGPIAKGKPRLLIEPKDEKEEERRRTGRKRKPTQPYTPPIDTVKVTNKKRHYIQPGNGRLIGFLSLTVQLIKFLMTS